LDPTMDAFKFRTTRSGRCFAEWGTISTTTFDIATALAHSMAVNAGQEEDLAELDTGPPLAALAALSLSSSTMPFTSTPSTEPASTTSTAPKKSRKEKNKEHSKKNRAARRASEKAQVDLLDGQRRRHARHLVRTQLQPIRASFSLRKTRIAATGWIGLRDDGVFADEVQADRVECGVSPTHRLPDFFGPKARFHNFQYV
ncbi:hypothetical protein R3P38DRAFT_2353383, partial [Favolaschia claudopus]